MCVYDVVAAQEEMHWLDGAMKDLELSVVEAEAKCNRWTASRGVDPDALKEIYSYLTADMANEWVPRPLSVWPLVRSLVCMYSCAQHVFVWMWCGLPWLSPSRLVVTAGMRTA